MLNLTSWNPTNSYNSYGTIYARPEASSRRSLTNAGARSDELVANPYSERVTEATHLVRCIAALQRKVTHSCRTSCRCQQ